MTNAGTAGEDPPVVCGEEIEDSLDVYAESELVIGLVGAVGTEIGRVADIIEERLQHVFKYTISRVHISREVIPQLVPAEALEHKDQYERINKLMDAGDNARATTGDNSILALGAVERIFFNRVTDDQDKPAHAGRRAYIILSLKHPAEVIRLREIYPSGFYLFGIHADEKQRLDNLVEEKSITLDQAKMLADRDADERLPYGQRLIDTFHLSDFFLRFDGDDKQLKRNTHRVLDIMFGHPYKTPTFDEYAMFLAFAAALRSADLSRQVGAVIGLREEILATGANDVPKKGGGLYWPVINKETRTIEDLADGREYTLKRDTNRLEQQRIIDGILHNAEQKGIDRQVLSSCLEDSGIRDLTEYGRMVHAEMEALLSCARNTISARGATIYCTTFPCHNCAKHIIASGITRVVYVEPYVKSRAADFHKDSISMGFDEDQDKVLFEPFVGIGPRRFFDLFSMGLGSGFEVVRKVSDGSVLGWRGKEARLRIPMRPFTYLDLEAWATEEFKDARKRMEGDETTGD